MSKPREQINDWLKNIDVTGKTVLDIGAGRPRAWLFPPKDEGSPKVTGKPLAYHTADIDEQWGCDAVVDLNVKLSEQIGDLSTLGFSHDYVFCLETLEHIYDPIQTIKNLAEITEEKLFITVPFVYPLHDRWDMLRYTYQWFERVLPKFGFRDVKVSQIKATVGKDDLHEFFKKEGMRMSKVTIKQGLWEHYFDIANLIEATK